MTPPGSRRGTPSDGVAAAPDTGGAYAPVRGVAAPGVAGTAGAVGRARPAGGVFDGPSADGVAAPGADGALPGSGDGESGTESPVVASTRPSTTCVPAGSPVAGSLTSSRRALAVTAPPCTSRSTSTRVPTPGTSTGVPGLSSMGWPFTVTSAAHSVTPAVAEPPWASERTPTLSEFTTMRPPSRLTPEASAMAAASCPSPRGPADTRTDTRPDDATGPDSCPAAVRVGLLGTARAEATLPPGRIAPMPLAEGSAGPGATATCAVAAAAAQMTPASRAFRSPDTPPIVAGSPDGVNAQCAQVSRATSISLLRVVS